MTVFTTEADVPTYQYACTACGHQLEAVQAFSDDPLTVCPACEGRLRKLFGSVGVVFKGSGFYRTDSRSDSTPKSDKTDAPKTDTPAKPAAEPTKSTTTDKSSTPAATAA